MYRSWSFAVEQCECYDCVSRVLVGHVVTLGVPVKGMPVVAQLGSFVLSMIILWPG